MCLLRIINSVQCEHMFHSRLSVVEPAATAHPPTPIVEFLNYQPDDDRAVVSHFVLHTLS